MALTGLQIQKLLPKTNCKECGSNTCLAFAMKLAGKKAELSECPYASDEAKAVLGAASEPPVRTVKIGDKPIGGETVLYRHEKTFVNEPALAVNVKDTDADAKKTIEDSAGYVLERVGEELRLSAIAVTQTEDDPAKFLEVVRMVADAGMPAILCAKGTEAVKPAVEIIKDTGGVIANCTKDNVDELSRLASEFNLVLAVSGSSVDEIAGVTARVKEGGFNDMIIDIRPETPAEAFQLNSIMRKAAFQNIKPVGYAFLRFIEDGDLYSTVAAATGGVCKYDGLIVFPKFDIAVISTIMALRQNIYTDPQKPIQMEPGVYPIGEPNEDSYVFLTTNFSLTYFLVSGEIEGAGMSAYLVLPECEGLSVLTAWAAGKFGGEKMAAFLKEQEFYKTHRNKTLIIPGFVSQESGEAQEGLPGWKVMVGCQEAGDFESYAKANNLV